MSYATCSRYWAKIKAIFSLLRVESDLLTRYYVYLRTLTPAELGFSTRKRRENDTKTFQGALYTFVSAGITFFSMYVR